jgi:cellulose biosynthesis protein BcsQ
MKTVALFNNKGGAGKTTLAYHLAHMLARLGYPTVAVDLDPQANLTSAFFDEDRLEELWDEGTETILACVEPILKGTGDIREPVPLEIADNLWMLAGDLGLSRFEDKLSDSWPRGYNNDQAALRTTSAFHRIIRRAASGVGAAVALLDVGPNLGAINRAALLAADFLVIPLAADLFSLQGLKNLGPTVRTWRQQWNRLQDLVSTDVDLPAGMMTPAGYVVLQHAVRLDRPVRAYGRWLERIPAVYQEVVLGGETPSKKALSGNDEHCLATLRNYRSLMPMAQDARKPMFDLRPADGAIGSHAQLVQTCADAFRDLAQRIADECSLEKPE